MHSPADHGSFESSVSALVGPQLPTPELPKTLPPPLPFSPTVWVISESERTCNFLQSQLRDRDFECSETYTVADMNSSMSLMLTKLRERKPDLIWISSLHHDNKSRISDATQIAARLLISEQHSLVVAILSLRTQIRMMHIQEYRPALTGSPNILMADCSPCTSALWQCRPKERTTVLPQVVLPLSTFLRRSSIAISRISSMADQSCHLEIVKHTIQHLPP